jgi:hypothetical protein
MFELLFLLITHNIVTNISEEDLCPQIYKIIRRRTN